MADLVPIIAYPPVQQDIKVENLEGQPEINSVQEERLTLQVCGT